MDDPLPLLIERVRLIKAAQGLEASARALQELAQQYPGDAEVLAMLAETQFEQGQIDAGLQTARQALQGSKGSLEPHMEALLHYLLGSQLRRAVQLDKPVHHLSEALQLDPDRFEAYMELGQTQRDRRQLAQALQVYQQAIDLFPYDPRPYHQAGVTLKEMKDYLPLKACCGVRRIWRQTSDPPAGAPLGVEPGAQPPASGRKASLIRMVCI